MLVRKFKNLREFGLKTDNRTYVIAEIGINHMGDLDNAKKLIDSAARTGCDAVKFQTYITEKRAPKNNPSIYQLLKDCELNFEDFGVLKEHSAGCGLEFFSTPFDEESVDYLESINVELYKIASFDVVNNSLLRYLAKTGKPLIMSVGMSSPSEIDNAVSILSTKNKLSILHCVSAYPTLEQDSNLSAIPILADNYQECVIGQSDHTNGIRVPLYAVACGAQVIEKHYRINDDMSCVDAPVSISETQMKKMVTEIRAIEKIFGFNSIGLTDVQRSALEFRRYSS